MLVFAVGKSGECDVILFLMGVISLLMWCVIGFLSLSLNLLVVWVLIMMLWVAKLSLVMMRYGRNLMRALSNLMWMGLLLRIWCCG